LTIVRDITITKQAEMELGKYREFLEERIRKKTAKLKKAEEIYRRIFEESGAPSIIIDDTLTVWLANSKFEQSFGYDRKEIEGKMKLTDFTASEDGKRVCRYHRSNEEKSTDIPDEYQCRIITRNSEERFVAVKVGRIPAYDRSILSFMDITDAKRQERQLRRENLQLRASISERYRFGDIIGKSRVMQEVYETILRAATTHANVVIYGESGTGKELVARAIHRKSDRRDRNIICVNCGAIPETLMESEFFGHCKGAFTGADFDKPGYLDLADGGILFLDEIGEIRPDIQVKLLRAIDGGGYTPVGGRTMKKPNLRIIAATHQNLMKLVETGRMRKDFFYRIHIIPIRLPPLRDRKEDVPLLIEHFMDRFSRDGAGSAHLPAHIFQALQNYDWPGNVRELQNVLQRYLTLKKLDFPVQASSVLQDLHDVSERCAAGTHLNLRNLVGQLERNVIENALAQNGWHRSRVAGLLGIDRKTLLTKMKKFGLTPD